MKTIRITFAKEGAQAAWLMKYSVTHWPAHTEWSGTRQAFTMPDGFLIDHFGGLDHLERVVAHYASLCGATFTIEDLGGEARLWEE